MRAKWKKGNCGSFVSGYRGDLYVKGPDGKFIPETLPDYNVGSPAEEELTKDLAERIRKGIDDQIIKDLFKYASLPIA